jgi:hypothetical protein
MRQASITEMIRRSLRDQYDAVLTEPLPRRWVDLINRLGQQEGKAPQPKADPDQRAIEGLEVQCGSPVTGSKH